MKLMCVFRLHDWQLLWIHENHQPMITCKYCNAGKFIGFPRLNTMKYNGLIWEEEKTS